MLQKAEQHLQGMLNKSYRYGTRILTITGYRVDEPRNRVYLHTNERKDHYDRPLDGLVSFLQEFQPVDQLPASPEQATAALVLAIDTTSSFEEAVLDSIKRVQKDPAYIPQANAISQSVTTLINLKRLQLDTFRTAQKIKKGD